MLKDYADIAKSHITILEIKIIEFTLWVIEFIYDCFTKRQHFIFILVFVAFLHFKYKE